MPLAFEPHCIVSALTRVVCNDRLQVKYLATHPDGETSALHLPVPRTAFVPATHVQFEEPQ